MIRREPVYEEFKKTGERILCSACGHEFAPDEPPTPPPAKPAIFGPDDLPLTPRVFDETERGRCCRYCRHYVVNPFRQWCGRHERETEATDLCDDFVRKDDEA